MSINEDKKKMFVRYTAQGMPVYENELGKRVCNLEGCYLVASNDCICHKHRLDENDYSDFLESIKRPLNKYTLINDEYYEMTVSNSSLIYKISKEDYDFAREYSWRSINSGKDLDYLVSSVAKNRKTERMKFHSKILEKEIHRKSGKSGNLVVDHISGDITDNRRENLRVCTSSENNMNAKISSSNTSTVVGVEWIKRTGKWRANITVDRESISLGAYYYFRNAVVARIEAEDKYFGEYAFRLRDENYRRYIDTIINSPQKEEPVIRKRPLKEPHIFGISLRTNKDGSTSYLSRVYDKKTQGAARKDFRDLESAVKWKKEKEVELYGSEIIHDDEIDIRKEQEEHIERYQ